MGYGSKSNVVNIDGDKLSRDIAGKVNGCSGVNIEVIGGNDAHVKQVIIIGDNGSEQEIIIDSVAAATDDDWD